MTQPKPVSYPNLLKQIEAVVSAHEAIHDEAKTHVRERHEKLQHARTQLAAAHAAKALIEGDDKS